LTDTFPSTDSEHIAIRLGNERGNGIPALQTKTVAREAMQKAGLQLIVTEDLAQRPDPLPWWYRIFGDVKTAQGLQDWMLVLRNTKYGRWVVRLLVRTLEFVRFAPKGTAKITEELIMPGTVWFLEGGKAYSRQCT
jgi:sterol 24-C-methyltransferase